MTPERDAEGEGRPTAAIVDLDAVRRNVAAIRQHVGPDTAVMAVVKADGYGHGAVPVARAALEAGASWLGVALAEEGRALRAAGFDGPILVLGATAPGQADTVVRHGLQAVVHTREAVSVLAERARVHGRRVAVHLKVDTGMTRLGLADADAVRALALEIAAAPYLELVGFMSHLADADHPDAGWTERQYARYLDLLDAVRRSGIDPPVKHLANSAGLFRFPGLQMDLVRSGLAVYGLSPGVETPPLSPAMTLVSRIVQVRRVPAGVGVGYGHTYVTRRPTVLAVVPIGYADGYRRGLSNRAAALVGGRRAPVVGRISMDQSVLAIPEDGEARVGDEVVLLGRQGDATVGAEEWAGWLDTIPYEVVTGIGARVPRRYRGLRPDASVDGDFGKIL